LELRVNNKAIGTGQAVKVGENFGLRITFMGDLKERITALGTGPQTPTEIAEAPAASVAPTQAA
jgi:hypothetical protein